MNYYNHHLGPLLDGEQDLITGLMQINRVGKPNSTFAVMEDERPHLQWWNETYPLHADFNYQHNEWNFRSGAIVRDCAVAFYGCSMTWGHGIPEATRWTDLVASQHGLSFNNFGLPGMGTDSLLDIFWATSQHVKMQTAVFMLNGAYRPQVVLGDGQVRECYVFTPSLRINNKGGKMDAVYYRDQLYRMPDEYFEHINAQAIIKIHRLCKLMNIRAIFTTPWTPCYQKLVAMQKELPITVTASPLTVLEGGYPENPKHQLARDRGHLGMEANQNLTLLFKDLF
jgi:hypothetical protein